MGRFDETIHVTEEAMKCAANPNDPITDVALAVQEHYGCPWRAAEDVAIRVRHIMREQGWNVTRPNHAPGDGGKEQA
jgi:pseudouridine-5'-phosphate glycosidase